MTTRQSNPYRRPVVTINASNGAYVLIAAQKFARKIEIQEVAPATGETSSDYAPQGFNYTLPDDGYVAIYSVLPGAILTLGDDSWKRERGYGAPPIPYPDGTTTLGTPYCKIISAASASQVEVREWS